jgi:hypothetical protein
MMMTAITCKKAGLTFAGRFPTPSELGTRSLVPHPPHGNHHKWHPEENFLKTKKDKSSLKVFS